MYLTRQPLRCIAEKGGFTSTGTADKPTLIYIDCIASNGDGTGFTFSSGNPTQGNILLERCIAFNHKNLGFSVNDLGTGMMPYAGVMKECIAYKNGLNGFIDAQGASSTMRYVANYAYDNGTTAADNYSPSGGTPFSTTSVGSAGSFWRNISE